MAALELDWRSQRVIVDPSRNFEQTVTATVLDDLNVKEDLQRLYIFVAVRRALLGIPHRLD
jgi:hypothetical protein